MAEERIPVFEIHILPMFRWIDREHMAQRGTDLTSYDVVRNMAQEILDKLKDDTFPMPTRRAGGPWPKEWIDLFDRWKQTGFQRLMLGQGRNHALVKAGANYRLSCDVDLPDPNARAWLDLKESVPAKLVYQLSLEPTANAAPSPQAITLRETIRGPLSVATIAIVDAGGEHQLPLPTV